MATTAETPQEGVFGSDNLTSAYLEPVTSEAEIDYSLVYALFTFVASMEGQISVLKGEPLELLDDSNSYWWAVKCMSTSEIGYIPAENIERNVDLTGVKTKDLVNLKAFKGKKTKLAFAEYHTEIYTGTGRLVTLDGESEVGLQSTDDDLSSASGSQDRPRKSASPQKRPSFLDRFFKKKEAPKPAPQPESVAESRDDVRAGPRKVSQPIRRFSVEDRDGEQRDLDRAPINVLRVFTGNVTFNTTFKSISFERNTLVEDLLYNTLKKFRVSNPDPNMYYLTVTPIEVSASALGERRLMPDENINNVLDSYGVMSFLTEMPSADGRQRSLSRVNQADGTIKITIYQYTEQDLDKVLTIRLCLDDADNAAATRWEQLEIRGDTTSKSIIADGCRIFNLDPAVGCKLYNMTSRQYLEPDVPIMPLAEIATAKEQYLTLKLQPNPATLDSRKDTPASAAPPYVRPTTLDPGRPSPSALESRSVAKSASFDKREKRLSGGATKYPKKSGSTEALSQLQQSLTMFIDDGPLQIQKDDSLDFDSMLSSLDSSIETQNSNPVILGADLGQFLGDMQRDLETLISAQLEKTAKQRRESRLSVMYNEKEVDPDIDSEQLFLAFKASGNELSRLEQNLNNMVGYILARNGIEVN
ncbi:hypothetical protein HDU91_002496 [Kappamyces sp. JEL0680]|nr:hypothetical protein HDU91_002496 [Kappamyces sp. JEL0680]